MITTGRNSLDKRPITMMNPKYNFVYYVKLRITCGQYSGDR